MGSPQVFLSYRRDDSRGYAGRLSDKLTASYGSACVFRDVDSIEAGSNYRERIEAELIRCDVLIVLVGDRFAERWRPGGEPGARPLDAQEDLLRREIEVALQRGIPILPLLIEGAAMPGEADLPPSIDRFALTQGLPITDQRWPQGVSEVLAWIDKATAKAASPPKAPIGSATSPAPPSASTAVSWPSAPLHSFAFPLNEDRRSQAMPSGTGGVNGAAISPDGHWLAAVGSGNAGRIWDIATRQESHPLEPPQEGTFARLMEMTAVSFGSDSRWLVTSSTDGMVRRWDAIDGEELDAVGHDRSVTSVAISSDGRWMATGSRDNGLQLWTIIPGVRPTAAAPKLTHPSTVTSVAFSPDSRWLASGCEDGKARIWEVKRPDRPRVIGRAEMQEVTSVAFSRDGSLLATGSKDGRSGTARIWDPQTRQHRFTFPHDYWVTAVWFSPVGDWLVTGSLDGTRIWDVQVHELLHTFTSAEPVRAAAFSADGELLAICFDDRVELWALAGGQEPPGRTIPLS
jgi:WD40 repeat protein